MVLKITPTEEQVCIQTTQQRTVIVQANAGAAKTTTLALRVWHALARGVSPERILVLTTTDPAGVAMRGALRKVGLDSGVIERLGIDTFETFSKRVLRGAEGAVHVPQRLTAETLAPTVREALRRLDMGLDDGQIVAQFLKLALRLKGTLAREQVLWQGERITPELADDWGVAYPMLRLFSQYEELRYPQGDHCDRANFRGPFDATYDLARLLANPESTTPRHELQRWPQKLAYVLVDELHDLNVAAYTVLLHLLHDAQIYFCAVGDIDQVVFSAAGAEQRYLQTDIDWGPGRCVKTYPLTASWRFGSALAEIAKRLSDKPYTSECQHTTAVRCDGYDTPNDCAEQVAALALAWKKDHAPDMRGLAILLRHPYQSVLIENALLGAQLPYQTVGFGSYLHQPEVLLVRALLALHGDGFEQIQAQATREALVRALVFFCGVDLEYYGSQAESSEQRLAHAVTAVAQDAGLLRVFFENQVLRRSEPQVVRRLQAGIRACGQSGPQMFAGLLDALEIEAWVKTVFVEKQRQADALAYMVGLRDAASRFTTAQAFFESLNRSEAQLTGSLSARVNKAQATVRAKKNLVLATVADVKGLEFVHVVMPYLVQGQFPAQLASSDTEERNLFYVGITRAREALTLLASRDAPSRFLAKMAVLPEAALGA
jgi:DNA helicase II / ATP-dependent DNA helicase PcrA